MTFAEKDFFESVMKLAGELTGSTLNTVKDLSPGHPAYASSQRASTQAIQLYDLCWAKVNAEQMNRAQAEGVSYDLNALVTAPKAPIEE